MIYRFTLCLSIIVLFSLKQTKANDNLVITYQLSYKTFKSKPSRSKAITRLFIGKHQSYFLDDRLVRLWSVNRNKDLSADQKMGEILAIGGIADREIIAKDFDTGKTMYAKEYLNQEYFGFEADLMRPEAWEILSDTATLFNLKAQKAICDFGGRKWEAWFCSELPISDGPYKFSGLPGLIIQLESTDKDYSFTLRHIEKRSEMPPLPDVKMVSRIKFNELQQYLVDNPFAMMESRGIEIRTHKYNGKTQTREEAIVLMKKQSEDLTTIEIE